MFAISFIIFSITILSGNFSICCYITYTYISHTLYVIVTPYNYCGILIYLDCAMSINHTLLPSALCVRVRNSTLSLLAIFKIGLFPNDKMIFVLCHKECCV